MTALRQAPRIASRHRRRWRSASRFHRTSYDVLGRPTQVTTPDINGGTATAGIAYSGRATTTTDPRGNTNTKVVNGLGELTSVTDDAGLVTTYWYQADGTNYQVQSNAGRGDVENIFQFDAWGRKVLQNDPDTGITQFGYNALGEVIWQQHESDARIENAIDARGRVWQRTVKPPGGAAESVSTFEYDTAANGLGQLANESISGTYSGWTPGTGTNLSFARSYSYDPLGRALGTTTTLDSANYSTEVSYDALGRPWKAKDASGKWSKTQYNAQGMAMKTCGSTPGDTDHTCYVGNGIYLETLATDAWGHVSKERRGNSAAMIVERDYAPETGRLGYLCAGTVGTNGCAIFDAGYNWDKAGNLITQTFSTGSRYAETYSYDGLNRLTQAKLIMQGGVTQNTVTQAFEYDALGNICRRSGSLLQTASYTYLGRSGCGLGDAKNSAFG